jgi:hypothetical protein
MVTKSCALGEIFGVKSEPLQGFQLSKSDSFLIKILIENAQEFPFGTENCTFLLSPL